MRRARGGGLFGREGVNAGAEETQVAAERVARHLDLVLRVGLQIADHVERRRGRWRDAWRLSDVAQGQIDARVVVQGHKGGSGSGSRRLLVARLVALTSDFGRGRLRPRCWCRCCGRRQLAVVDVEAVDEIDQFAVCC